MNSNPVRLKLSYPDKVRYLTYVVPKVGTNKEGYLNVEVLRPGSHAGHVFRPRNHLTLPKVHYLPKVPGKVIIRSEAEAEGEAEAHPYLNSRSTRGAGTSIAIAFFQHASFDI